MPEITWLAALGGVVVLGTALTYFAVRRVLRSAYRSETRRPEPPKANASDDRTPPGT